MSTISSLIVTCSIMEKDAITALNAWSQQLDCPVEFVQLDLDEAANAGLNKPLRVDVYAAAQAQVDAQALLTMFRTFPWEWPGEAVLMVYPEDGPPRILRGNG